jgi:microcystin-dependent protein
MMPVGMIFAYVGNVDDPKVRAGLKAKGWLPCDGSAVSRKEYNELFDVISTTFGSGDGVGTFLLPDLRGRFLRGLDTSGNVDRGSSYRYDSGPGGVTRKNTVGTVQDCAVQSHQHILPVSKAFGIQKITWGVQDESKAVFQVTTKTPPEFSYYGEYPTDAAGDKETRPTNIAVYWIIRAK